ncbi:MAG: hypothetical protein LBC96_02400 [Lachnospiraceae bacterium]|jgi:hypothetical protein|nr:hypothetical protein [Lachnospiraceae bacterium]
MTAEKKRIYIVVKTYPTISKEYSELVCTAGVLEDGSWIRLYPIPFKKLEDYQKYPKYTWVEVEATRNTSDFRPESYRPTLTTISVSEKHKKVDWDERRRIVFNNNKIYTNLQELIDKAKTDGTSLAAFKPAKIHDFVVEPTDRDWDAEKLAILKNLSQQLNLFQSPEEIEAEYKVVPKVPYKFSYRLEDDCGKQSTMMIEDWEIGMLYFNCLKRAGGSEKEATEKVRQKYYDEFLKKDLHLFLGTTKQFHNVAPNPFIIVGVFYPPMPPKETQISLF